ncbi:MAG: hypothetical protein GX569_07925 [Candidatus Riflebacteria bacterium]|nr:hypothetical protein [Candidatus Riflebacteria bacterium]
MLDRELVENLYSSKSDVKRAAVYRLLFDRRYDLLDELKKAATFEKNEEMAVFMVQVCLTLENFPRDLSLERRIVELLQKEGGAVSVSEDMWKYLETHGSSQMLLAALGAMGDAIPPAAQDFIEACLTHPDPEIRAAVCQKAIKSGRPTYFAFVLNLITDPDPYVSQTAFMVIKELPGDELAIILDYALGSPDEWVLNNVAPFLPLIINNAVRKVVAKVSYHKHPLIAKKAREALKQLDAIPFISKRKAEAEAAAAAEKESGEEAGEGDATEAETGEKKLSLKEQMELKRQQQLEEERKRKAEEEAMAAELASVKPEDLDELAGEINRFNAEPGAEISTPPASVGDDLIAEDTELAAKSGFEEQAKALDDIEVDEHELEAVLAQTVADAGKPAAGKTVAQEDEIVILDPKTIDFEKAQQQFSQAESTAENVDLSVAASSAESDDIDILVVDETAPAMPAVTEDNAVKEIGVNIAAKPEHAESVEKTTSVAGSPDSMPSVSGESSVAVAAKASVSGTATLPASGVAEQVPSVAASADSEKSHDVAIDKSQVQSAETTSSKSDTDSTGMTKPSSPMPPSPAQAPPAGKASQPVRTAPEDVSAQAKPIRAKSASATAQAAPGARPVLPPEAREIAAIYPSFLVDPFVQLFVPADNKTRLMQIGQVLDNLTAFLNLCYLQSCLFFAPESEALARSIVDCIKGELIGPTSLRCLHNFVLSMKQARGNPVFFTFSLAGVLSDASDANPLMMMRELKEYLREPVEPLDESIPQAIEGITEILRGVKSLVNNLLVMKAPPGAKEPFADLSGPVAKILPLEKRPALDLPVGEVILISRDGTEALGLFPYFKYSRKKVVFAKPSLEERNILLERLEIPVEELE